MTPLSLSDVQLLQNYCALAERHFQRLGIEVTFDPLVGGWVDHMTRHAAGTGVGVNRAFDPSCNHLTPANSFWARCATMEGEIVSVMAARLLDCRDVGQELMTQRLWYGRQARPVPGLPPHPLPAGTRIAGRVVHTGGHWTHPDWRDGARRARGLEPARFSEVLPRVVRSVCVLHFDADWMFSMTVDSMNDAGLPTGKYGYPRVTHWYDGHFPGFDRHCRVGLVDISREEQVALMRERYFAELAGIAVPGAPRPERVPAGPWGVTAAG